MKKTLLFVVFALIFTVQAAATMWVDAKKEGSTAYFLHKSAPRVERYDLASGKWLSSIALGRIPTAFHVDAEYLYVAFDKVVYRYSHTGGEEFHLGNFQNTVVGIFADGDILIINHAGSQYGHLNTLNRVTAAPIHKTTTYVEAGHTSAHFPQNRAIYGTRRSVSPQDITVTTYNESGFFIETRDSPHHGDYRIGSTVFVWPDGSKIADTTGNVYDGISLQHVNSFATDVTDLAFFGGEIPIAISGNRIVSFSKALLETGSKELAVAAGSIFARTDDIAAFYVDSSTPNGMNVLFVKLDELSSENPGEAIDPRALAFIPDEVFLDKNNVLFLYSKAHASLFRWNVADQDWAETIPLLGAPDHVEYAPVMDRVYTVYNDGKIKVIDLLGSAPVELPFANLPTGSLGMVACGEFLVTSDLSGPWETHRSFSPEGVELDYKDWNYPLKDAQWDATNRRIYHFRDGSSPNDLHWEGVSPNGKFEGGGETPLHGGVGTTYPIRVKPGGSIVLLGSGKVYDAISMEFLSTLPEGHVDATWVNGQLFTLSTDKIKAWALPTYAEGASMSYVGSGRRLISTIDGKLILVALDSEGIPRFSVFDAEYDLIPPTTLAAPELELVRNSASAATIRWSNVNGEEEFLVERRTGSDGTWQALATTEIDVTRFADDTIGRGHIYFYRVKARNDELESAYSNELAVNLVYHPVDGAPVAGPDFAFNPDEAFIDNGNVLYLLSKEHQSLLRWDITSQRWLAAIPLREAPSFITYSDINHVIYLAYPHGGVFQINLWSAPLVERPFVTLEPNPRGLIAAGEFVVVVDDTPRRGTRKSFRADGEKVSESPASMPPLNAAAWSDVNRRIYHFRDGTSPNDLLWSQIGLDGTIAQQKDSPYHSSTGIEYPIRVSPNGKLVILGSGRIYDAVSLEQLDALANPIQDAAWLRDELFTLANSTITDHSNLTSASGDTFSLVGVGRRILATQDDHLAAISLDDNGRVRIGIYDGEYNVVAPPVIMTPEPSVVEVSRTSLTIAWADVSGEKRYWIQRRTGDSDWVQIGGTGADMTAFTDDAVTLGERYQYRVQADNDGQVSAFSDEVEAALLGPTMVQNLAGVANSETQITLSWDDADFETGYRVERKAAGGQWTLAGSIPAGVTEFVDSVLEKGVLYEYRIIGFNGIETAAASASISVETPVYPPGTPVILRAYAAGALRVDLEWSDVDGEETYRIERLATGGSSGTWEEIGAVLTDVTLFSDASVEPQTEYTYRIVAANRGGESAPVITDPITTPILTAPEPPELRIVSSLAIAVRLAWERQVDVTQYSVYRRINGEMEWQLISEALGTEVEFLDEAVQVGEVYEYALLASNPAGSSEWSAIVLAEVTDKLVLLEEDFEGGLDVSKWPIALGRLMEGGPEGSSQFLYFDRGQRILETRELQILDAGLLSFDLRAGNSRVDGPDWDNSEAGDNVIVEYHDGASWRLLQTLDTIYPEHRSWQSHVISIPEDLSRTVTRFRWKQPNSSFRTDQWGIDNIRITTRLVLPPEAPLLVVTGSMSPGSVTIFWLPVEAADFYILERLSGSGSVWEEVATVRAPEYHYTDETGLGEGASYRVIAGNTSGFSPPSAATKNGVLSKLEEWRARTFGTTENGGISHDEYVGENGMNNLVLYALNIAPGEPARVFDETAPLSGGLPRGTLEEGSRRLRLKFLRRRAESHPGIEYELQCADTLSGPWSVAGEIIDRQILDEEWEQVTWEDDVENFSGAARFVQLFIIKP